MVPEQVAHRCLTDRRDKSVAQGTHCRYTSTQHTKETQNLQDNMEQQNPSQPLDVLEQLIPTWFDDLKKKKNYRTEIFFKDCSS